MRALKDILYDALNKGASDIHFYPGLPLVHRIDGELIIPEADAPLSYNNFACTVNALAASNDPAPLRTQLGRI